MPCASLLSCPGLLALDGWLCCFPHTVLLPHWARPDWGQGCQDRDLLEELALLTPRAALQGLALGL